MANLMDNGRELDAGGELGRTPGLESADGPNLKLFEDIIVLRAKDTLQNKPKSPCVTHLLIRRNAREEYLTL